MISDTDLPEKPETFPQPRSFKPLSWKVIFILLLVVKVIFVFWAADVLKKGSHGTADFSALGVFVVALPLAVIDLIALLSYGFKHRPHSKARVISSTVFILISIPLIYTFLFYVIGLIGSFILRFAQIWGRFQDMIRSRHDRNSYHYQ